MKKLSKTALAKQLGVSRSTLYAWMESGCPQDSVAAIQGWLTTTGIGVDTTAPPDIRRKLSEKRLEILEQQRIAAVRENQIRAGETMLVADAERQAAEAMVVVFAELERREREMPPKIEMMDKVSIFKIIHADTEQIRKTCQEKFQTIGATK